MCCGGNTRDDPWGHRDRQSLSVSLDALTAHSKHGDDEESSHTHCQCVYGGETVSLSIAMTSLVSIRKSTSVTTIKEEEQRTLP